MTRRDYFAVAKAVKEVFETRDVVKRSTLVDALCVTLRENNPNFQEFRFKLSCGDSELDQGEGEAS